MPKACAALLCIFALAACSSTSSGPSIAQQSAAAQGGYVGGPQGGGR